jgi:Mor family transcriptional regulator
MGQIKLSIEKVRNIRKLYQTGNWTHEMLSKRYKCSRGHVTKIINQMRWSETKYPQLIHGVQEEQDNLH